MGSPSQPNPPEPSAPEEQPISPALRRRLQQCFEHSSKLMAQDGYDHDYAHTMLVECVTRDPGNLVYLDAFFANLRAKYNNNKRGSMLSFAGKGSFKKALARQEWSEVLRLGPEVLKANPWDVVTLRGMADACAAYGFHETELRYLKSALEVKPQDPAVNRHCARSLARIGQFDQAIACWHRVDEAKKGDREAQEMIGELQIEKTRNPSGHRPGRKTRPQVEGEKAPTSEAPRREIELTPRQQLEQAISINPTDLESYFELADLHTEAGRLGEAAHVLTKALAASGNEIRIQQKLEDVEILRLRHKVEIAERRHAKEETDEHQQLIEQLRSDLNRYELEVYDRRTQYYPDDLELKFQLALRLKRAGNIRQAVELFEQAAQLPARQAGATFELGEGQQRLKNYAKAFELYTQAADWAEHPELKPLRLMAWYRAAVLASGLGNAAAAESLLEKIVAIDPDYRDAVARLDKVRQMRHKG